MFFRVGCQEESSRPVSSVSTRIIWASGVNPNLSTSNAPASMSSTGPQKSPQVVVWSSGKKIASYTLEDLIGKAKFSAGREKEVSRIGRKRCGNWCR